MNIILSFMPLILVTILVIFAGILIIDDARHTKPKSRIIINDHKNSIKNA